MIKDGALSMEMDGHILTLKWPADNLDTPLQVYQTNVKPYVVSCKPDLMKLTIACITQGIIQTIMYMLNDKIDQEDVSIHPITLY